MPMFLGVDGGQSSTVAMIGDETGRIVGTGRGPAYRYEGAVEEALRSAGAADFTFEVACFGLSGGTAGQETVIGELVKASHYIVTHDAAVALMGALAGEPGIIAIAGTGSIAFGRNAEGQTAHAGGWGYAFGDEGGAFDLVRQALRAALRQEEGWGPPTALRMALLGASGAPHAQAMTANELMHRFYTPKWPRERIAALAPLVDQAAAGGDVVAQEILRGAAQALATIVGVVRGRLFEPRKTVAVGYAGGMFRSPVVLERFRMLVEMADGNRVQAPRFGGAAGALIEAYRVAGVEALPKDAPIEKQ
jgi:N-acetylglucosamine kinase-like BadF-type ATPase